MAMENLPITPAFLSFATEPVHLANTEIANERHAGYDCGNVAKRNVNDEVVPPALAEMRQDVLK